MKCFWVFFFQINLLKEPGLIKYPCPSPSLGAVEANLVVCGVSTFFSASCFAAGVTAVGARNICCAAPPSVLHVLNLPNEPLMTVTHHAPRELPNILLFRFGGSSDSQSRVWFPELLCCGLRQAGVSVEQWMISVRPKHNLSK